MFENPGIPDVLAEEPEVSFREISREEFEREK